ncbi:MAG TPA: PilZ domain-containing protein [Kofleriaceae bacterium]
MEPRAATAVVTRSTKENARFAIRDLSAGGARLVGELLLFEGEKILLRIELAEPVELAAEVTRVDQQRKVAEVVFSGVAADALAQIERAMAEVLASVRDTSPPTVVIVHPAVDVSSALERDLAKIGVAARVCATLPDLEWQLADKSVRFVGVIISGAFGEAIGPALQHVEDNHRGLSRVILFGDQIKRFDHPAVGRVHAVLRTPWRFKGLARALEVPPDSVVTTYDQLVALKAQTED